MADGAKQIQRPETRHRAQVAARGKMAARRAQAPLRLDPEDSIQGLQDNQNSVDVGVFERVDQVYIQCLDRSAMENRRHTALDYRLRE